MTAPRKLLFLGGYSRNGSTVVGRTLAEADGAICVGETLYVWSRGLQEGVTCNCGDEFRSCEFWGEVGRVAFGGWEKTDIAQLAEHERRLNRFVALPRHVVPMPAALTRARDSYADHLAALYEAVFAVSGAKIVVDTSKHPSFAATLRRLSRGGDLDLRLVHLVRDSRAVAHSWTRAKALPSPIGSQREMPRFRPAVSAARWLRWNLALDALGRRESRQMRLRYEDFASDPRGSLARLSEFAGADLTLPVERLTGEQVKLGENHIFSGNPMRARVGWVPLRVDDEWRTALTRGGSATVTALTWPLLWRYGYRA